MTISHKTDNVDFQDPGKIIFLKSTVITIGTFHISQV